VRVGECDKELLEGIASRRPGWRRAASGGGVLRWPAGPRRRRGAAAGALAASGGDNNDNHRGVLVVPWRHGRGSGGRDLRL
jgi:hypothetical protein